jgi:hypothetical protein
MSGNVPMNVYSPNATSANVFVLTSNHPIIGSWIDGHVNLTDGVNTYDYDVTEFDNIIADVVFGTYNYTFSQAGGCFADITGTLVVDCAGINPMSGNVLLNILDEGTAATSANVFVLTSNHPIIGSWIDGHVNLTDGVNTYDYDVTEFDNIIADVVFGTYTYTFSQAGGCFADITGTVVIDCASIDPMSGNVLLNILDEGTAATSANVFVLTSNHPIIGSWIDGHVNLTDGVNTYDYDVTEFDNIIADVIFGTYIYTFTQAGGCFADITGMVVIDCASIDPMSGNVLLNILDEGIAETSNDIFFFVGSPLPLGGATVTMTGPGGYNETLVTGNPSGDVFENVPFGVYDYTITKDCYETVTGSVTSECSIGGMGVSVFENPAEIVLDTTVTQNGNILKANATGVTYQWVDCDTMLPIPDATNQSYEATVDGNYAVIITSGTCSATSDCINVIVLGISSYETSLIVSLYPNPVKDYLMMEIEQPQGEIYVQIVNMVGQIVVSDTYAQSNSTELNISTLAAGVYTMKVRCNKKNFTARIIKE